MKYLDEIGNLAWTLGGTGLVLITLSGSTLQAGIWITVASAVLHFAAFALRSKEDNGSNE